MCKGLGETGRQPENGASIAGGAAASERCVLLTWGQQGTSAAVSQGNTVARRNDLRRTGMASDNVQRRGSLVAIPQLCCNKWQCDPVLC